MRHLGAPVVLFHTKADQVDAELEAFIGLLVKAKVRSFLEIGSQYGGSLWRIANALPAGSRIVSVDLPWGDKATEPHLMACYRALKAKGYDAHLFLGDSTGPVMVDQVRALGPFDAVFIDGNHTLPMVTQDWQNYGPMSRMVAFHDVAWLRPTRPGRLPIEVAQLWNGIKPDHRHQEFIAPGSEKGIGVLWN